MDTLRVRYQTLEFGTSCLHVRTLRDVQQFADPTGVAARLGISSASWPVFGVIWDSGLVLAHLMFEKHVGDRRILEVGCGIALASQVLNLRHADITATDRHPEAGNFLAENSRLNQARAVPFVRTAWTDPVSELGEFDLIIGSDLLYEHPHVEELATFIEQHAKPNCEVMLVDPGRGHHARFSKRMVTLGYSHSQTRPERTDFLPRPFRGRILRYMR
jgi:predicted nicotinamide N-methyase